MCWFTGGDATPGLTRIAHSIGGVGAGIFGNRVSHLTIPRVLFVVAYAQASSFSVYNPNTRARIGGS
jgi:hypothetical protein